jgi:imidazolonepropionase-like amidohydrolase
MHVAAILLLSLTPVQQDDGEFITLTNARILTGSGREFVKGSIVIADGKIVTVIDSANLKGARKVINLSEKVIIPGLIDAACALGVAGPANEDGEEVAPQVRIIDSLDPRSPDLARARQSGVTAAFVEPGNRGVIGGVASVIKTAGSSRAAMIVREEAAIKGAIGPGPAQGNYPPRGAAATFFARRPTTRMGVAWEFRKAFFDARRYGEAHDETDPGKELLLRALAGNLPVRIAASRVTDLETAIEIAKELGLSIAIEEAQESHKHAETLAKRNIPVLLRPVMGTAPGYAPEPNEIRLDAFTILIKAGVKTALLPAGEQKSDGMLASVAFAVRYGAKPADALRAATLTPAEILGVADRIGSIEKGKDADLVVLSGEPHEVTTRVEKVMIGGRWVYGESGEK